MVELYVDQLMSRPVETVTPETSLRDAAEALIRNDVGALVVVDHENRLEGLLTATDFVLLLRDRRPATNATVSERMQTDVITSKPSAPASEAVDAMLEHSIHHVPVLEGEDVVGMLTSLDLAAYLARSLEP